MQDFNLYQSAVVVGGCIFVLCILAYILAWFGNYAYAWLDDSKVGKKNLFGELLKKLDPAVDRKFKYGVYCYLFKRDSDNGDYGKFSSNKEDEGKHFADCNQSNLMSSKSICRPNFIFTTTIVSLLPLAVIIILDFIVVSLCIAGFALSAHLARFCFRHKKLFDKHLTDKKAHK